MVSRWGPWGSFLVCLRLFGADRAWQVRGDWECHVKQRGEKAQLIDDVDASLSDGVRDMREWGTRAG